ncbi:MAG: L-asparaginase [Gammaproteobacteria bacterium]|jgi:L-asparaginase
MRTTRVKRMIKMTTSLMTKCIQSLSALIVLVLISSSTPAQNALPGIAVFSGTGATIQNSPALVTSNKARKLYGLSLRKNPDGSTADQDHLVPQRLASKVEVYIEAYTAHPLERDAAELYGPPDGYLDTNGNFVPERLSPTDKPVYRVTLEPEDGLYLLPYMGRQANGQAWDDNCTHPYAAANQCRQPFFPDASRIFEEIDRGLYGLGDGGTGNVLSSKAKFSFYRALPSGGFKHGMAEDARTDIGKGDILPETMGEDFFAYYPPHLRTSTRYQDLATAANTVQQALSDGNYQGAIWLEGSPTIEETVYWLNLLIDTRVPIVANAAQRPMRTVSADGPHNIVDAVDYIVSKIWSDDDGNNELGAVMIQDEQIFAARQVQKSDARPGGYIATGDHGGILGTMGIPGPAQIYFKPVNRHTWHSDVRLTTLPKAVNGVTRINGEYRNTKVHIKDKDGMLLGKSIPRVSIVKYGYFSQEGSVPNPDDEVDIMARIEKNLKQNPLAGFIAEGLAPYGMLSRAPESALQIALFSGMPVVFTGRGNAGGATPTNYHLHRPAIAGNNLTATKARMLLTACLLKFGSLPPAQDPRNPTAAERNEVQALVAKYQTIFDSH